jgi:hypothetical protein
VALDLRGLSGKSFTGTREHFLSHSTAQGEEGQGGELAPP